MKLELTPAPQDLAPSSLKSLSDYKLGRIIGKGSFGKVFIAQEKSSGSVFAIKSIQKSRIQTDSAYSFIKSEKDMLSCVNSPFSVKFFESFQDKSNVYFVQEYLPGGELFSLISSKKRLEVSQAKLITAEIVMFFVHLHKFGVVYRDLKPENIMISATGHVKVVDFGFAARIEECSNTFCGTLEYLAPEMIAREGHGFEVDWWTLGILLFEMLTGRSPFRSKLPQVTFEKILKTSPEFPRNFDSLAKDLILSLLEKDPKKRIKSQDIQKHQFFKDINWDDIEKQSYPTFDVPILRSEMDSSYFPYYDERDTSVYNRSLKYSFEGF